MDSSRARRRLSERNRLRARFLATVASQPRGRSTWPGARSIAVTSASCARSSASASFPTSAPASRRSHARSASKLSTVGDREASTALRTPRRRIPVHGTGRPRARATLRPFVGESFRMHAAPLDPETALDRYRRTGDPQAFGALFDATASELHRAALSMLSDAVAADDAVQQTYLSALRLLDRFEPGRRVMPWLVGLLEGHVMHARRSVARRRVVASVPADAAAPLASDALPDADAERTRAAIEALEEPYRSTALLRWRYGLEPAEIAHVRGEPPGTTRSILSRAVAQLRRAL